ncbi:hypothetical protein [Actinokineospora sp. NBRC 105648]|uniref:hypothetical protein n=1 Tax=Actinokineospora sp. NBRC 105648 TaxID=3032206 RepID=UPI0024A0320A|nr:hypothetical protein [Actinokineospora sp. NBRC 105648]GLZ43411.1 hypothetical protein Acsp05_70350 [Actinokineospora sp. NBRC 105648]
MRIPLLWAALAALTTLLKPADWQIISLALGALALAATAVHRRTPVRLLGEVLGVLLFLFNAFWTFAAIGIAVEAGRTTDWLFVLSAAAQSALFAWAYATTRARDLVGSR